MIRHSHRVFFKTFTRFPRFFQPVFKWRKGPRYIRISSSYSASGAIILQWRMGITQKKWTTSKKPSTRRKLRRWPPPNFLSNDMFFFENMRPKMMWRMDMGYGFICRNWRAFWMFLIPKQKISEKVTLVIQRWWHFRTKLRTTTVSGMYSPTYIYTRFE